MIAKFSIAALIIIILTHHNCVFIFFVDSLSDYILWGWLEPFLFGPLLLLLILPFIFDLVFFSYAPDLILSTRIH